MIKRQYLWSYKTIEINKFNFLLSNLFAMFCFQHGEVVWPLDPEGDPQVPDEPLDQEDIRGEWVPGPGAPAHVRRCGVRGQVWRHHPGLQPGPGQHCLHQGGGQQVHKTVLHSGVGTYYQWVGTAWYQVNCLHHGGGQQVHKTVLHSGVGTYYQCALHGIKWIVSIKGEASRYTKQFYIRLLVLISEFLLPMGTAWYKVNCLHQGGGQQVRKQLYILVTDTDTDTGINESTNFRQNLLPTSTLWVLHCVQLTSIEIQWLI